MPTSPHRSPDVCLRPRSRLAIRGLEGGGSYCCGAAAVAGPNLSMLPGTVCRLGVGASTYGSRVGNPARSISFSGSGQVGPAAGDGSGGERCYQHPLPFDSAIPTCCGGEYRLADEVRDVVSGAVRLRAHVKADEQTRGKSPSTRPAGESRAESVAKALNGVLFTKHPRPEWTGSRSNLFCRLTGQVSTAQRSARHNPTEVAAALCGGFEGGE